MLSIWPTNIGYMYTYIEAIVLLLRQIDVSYSAQRLNSKSFWCLSKLFMVWLRVSTFTSPAHHCRTPLVRHRLLHLTDVVLASGPPSFPTPLPILCSKFLHVLLPQSFYPSLRTSLTVIPKSAMSSLTCSSCFSPIVLMSYFICSKNEYICERIYFLYIH